MFKLIRIAPLLSFFIFAFIIGWIPWIVRIYDPGFQFRVFVFAPLAAAFLVSAVTGVKELKQWLLRLIRWRVRWWWYAIAVALPIFIKEMANTINLMIGAKVSHGIDFAYKNYFENFRPELLLPLIGIFCGEAGWRGFAVPRLLQRYSVLATGLMMGLIWAAWNLPMIVSGEILLMDLAKGIALAIILAAIVQGTKGSVVVCFLMLASHNIIGSLYFAVFEGADAVNQNIILVVTWWAMAIIIVFVTNRQEKKISTDVINSKAAIQ